MKTILLITARADQGGGPRHVTDLARYLQRAGHRVWVASPTKGAFADILRGFAGHVELPHRAFSPLAFWRLWRTVAREGVSVVHSHGRGAGLYGRLLAFSGATVVHTFHGLHFLPGLRGCLGTLLETFLAPLTDLFICVATSERERALRLGLPAHRVVVRANGMDFTRFTPRAEIASHDALGTLSRLDPQKGNRRLVELVARLPSPATLRIAGDGEERPALEATIANLGMRHRVELIGEVTDVPGFLATLDVYVSASHGEGLPFAVLEAVAAGLPVVASDVPGHADILPADRLFRDAEEFLLRVTLAAAQDRARLRAQLAAEYDLEPCLEKIAVLYETARFTAATTRS